MSTKRWLIVIPLATVALLLQSAFWVPRYENQSVGNPKRLTTYIEAGIGGENVGEHPVATNADTQRPERVFPLEHVIAGCQ